MSLKITPEIIAAMPDPRLLMGIMRKMRAFVKPGELLKDKLGYSADLMEKLYALAQGLYEKAKYQESIELFEELFYLDPLSYKISFGLAASAQQLRDYYKAISFYSYAAENDPQAPEPLYFAAECSMQVGKETAAADLYRKAITLCSDNTHYKDLKERCLVLADTLEKRVKEGLPPLSLADDLKKS